LDGIAVNLRCDLNVFGIYWYREVIVMAKNTSVSLGEHFNPFIASQRPKDGLARRQRWSVQVCACLKATNANSNSCGE